MADLGTVRKFFCNKLSLNNTASVALLSKNLPELARLLSPPSHRCSSLPPLKLVEFQDLGSQLNDVCVICVPACLCVFLWRCQFLRFAQSDGQVCVWLSARCTYPGKGSRLEKKKEKEEDRWREGSGRDALLLPVHLLCLWAAAVGLHLKRYVETSRYPLSPLWEEIMLCRSLDLVLLLIFFSLLKLHFSDWFTTLLASCLFCVRVWNLTAVLLQCLLVNSTAARKKGLFPHDALLNHLPVNVLQQWL